MSDPQSPASRWDGTGQHRLGPHVVGRRVVVRRLLRGETGPSGGPAMTDVLGVCESWAEALCVVRREDGSRVSIRVADIVSGKPVPPRPSRFSRLSAKEIEQRNADLIRPRHQQRLGDWRLRYSGGRVGRIGSALLSGSPGVPFEEALDRVVAFYDAHGAPARAQVVSDSGEEARLRSLGWEQDTDDVDTLVGSVTQSVRRARPGSTPLTTGDLVTRDWLDVGSGRLSPDLAGHALQAGPDGPSEVLFVVATRAGEPVARARMAHREGWVCMTDLLVREDARRHGLAHAVLAEGIGWAAELGASTWVVQTLAANLPAQRLYGDLGLERHHGYRYLTRPSR